MSNKINNIREVINMYNDINDNLKILDKKSRELRKKKTKLENYIKNTIVINKLEEKDIKINSKSKIRYTTMKKKEPMSQKYLKNTLEDYYLINFKNRMSEKRCSEKAIEIYNYLIKNRKQKDIAQLKIINT
jgi:hypothetical protein